MPPEPQTRTTPCPSCGTPSSGKYCAECGAAMLGVNCSACGALLHPGSRYCHRCGTPIGAPAGERPALAGAVSTPPSRSIVPWVVAGAALLALVIMVAAQQGRGSTPPGSATMPLGAGAPGAAAGAVRAPDISSLTPRERADRLYDRVMTMSAQGKADSAAFFASMAVGAYEALAPLDNDLRYDYGRMAEMAGELDLAQAQADSILRENPDHLLGLILKGRVSQARGDNAGYQRYLGRVARAGPTELAKSLEEYTRHRSDIDAAISAARRN